MHPRPPPRAPSQSTGPGPSAPASAQSDVGGRCLVGVSFWQQGVPVRHDRVAAVDVGARGSACLRKEQSCSNMRQARTLSHPYRQTKPHTLSNKAACLVLCCCTRSAKLPQICRRSRPNLSLRSTLMFCTFAPLCTGRCVSVVRKFALTVGEGGSMLVIAHDLLLVPEVIADVLHSTINISYDFGAE